MKRPTIYLESIIYFQYIRPDFLYNLSTYLSQAYYKTYIEYKFIIFEFWVYDFPMELVPRPRYVFLFFLIQCLGLIIPLLISVAYFTLAERKIIAAIQRRKGPNVIGYYGLLQPLADGLKLFVKESICPSNAETGLFFFAPLLTFFLSLVGWAVIPFGPTAVLADIDLGILYIFAVSSLSVYGIITSGWASNSKYAFLGSLRSAAQIVSYEVSIGFIIATILVCVGSINLSLLVFAQEDRWFIWPHLPLFGIFLVSALAETNRHPFDLPEAEAELVSGYNVEYSAIGFALFFLGEYANIILISSFTSLLFLGGWLPPFDILNFVSPYLWFGLKTSLFVVFFICIRASLPRYRYDQLINLGWKVFLPFTLAWLILSLGLLLGTNSLPSYIS
jgi:NADH-quinone oxidoreductase subunit H